MAESSTKPYLIRAIHEWCTDNGYTPYVAVAVDQRTLVPREHVRNGEIVLNVSSLATNGLRLGNDLIEFQARFGGVPRNLSIPVENVSAIYARENGHGMAFEVAKAPTVEAVSQPEAEAGHGGAQGEASGEEGQAATPPVAAERGTAPTPAKPPQLVSVGGEAPRVPGKSRKSDTPDPDGQSDEPDPPDTPPAKPRQSRPKLTRIK